MHGPDDIPAALGGAFSVSAARAAGVSVARLRRRDLNRPFWGVRARAAPAGGGAQLEPGSSDAGIALAEKRAEVCERVRQLAPVMPAGGFVTHVTAAVVWGIALPAAVVLAHDLIDIGVFCPGRNPRRRGVRGHEVVVGHAHVMWSAECGAHIASPASVWAQLARVLIDPYDLVAAGDSVVREPMFTRDGPPLATHDQLANAVAAGRRVGVGRLREALPSVRTRAASRPETWCRMALVDAGLPEPALNVDVFDEVGAFLACVDLAYPALKIAIEYEGAHHRLDSGQWSKDIARYERLGAAGWLVIRVTKDQLFEDPASVAARVRAARRARSRA